MKQSVRDAFIPFTTAYEGLVHFMYQDVKGLVSTGIGNKLDSSDEPQRPGPPYADALRLPWVRLDGVRATKQEIIDEWTLVKNFPNAARLGHTALTHVTKLRLTDEAVEELVIGKMEEMAAELAKRFPEFEFWPADAQLATLSMSWACGPAFHFPRLASALTAQDFSAAVRECTIQETGNPGVIPRNHADRVLYANAAAVVESGMLSEALDPDVLYWPRCLPDELGAGGM